jgi:pyruvate/2-oxoglutarate dehydrogenase complex dihydrolipoamide dehydrogenase (E3) component
VIRAFTTFAPRRTGDEDQAKRLRVLAGLLAAELGARTVLVTSGEFGGMAANDGPVPVRVLAHAARLIREAPQLGQYGLTVR